tara:strand:+ start:508 stop:1101 length:594 start_codon:yes stop_codon:yes gene_type:complete
MTQHVRNIMKVYRKANDGDIANGLEWYARARREAVSISDELGLPLASVVGVMAALSPNNRWERNKIDAYNMCSVFIRDKHGLNTFKVSTYNTMKGKAWSILSDELADNESILARLNGQKIRSFYSNIIGLQEVTVDGHALNIARGKREGLTSDKTNIGKVLYRELQAAYIRAAKLAGIKPHEMQAITWTVWKRVHNI